MANQNNIKLINGINGELSIEADKGKIGQVISNLISNAIKFSVNGKITVEAS